MDTATLAPARKQLRSFGLIMAFMIGLIFGGVLPYFGHLPQSLWTWSIVLAFALTGLVVPGVLLPVYRVWMKFGHALGWLNGRIILGLVFYVMVTPMGVVMRLLGKDPMRRRLDPGQASYRVPSHPPPKNQLERPF